MLVRLTDEGRRALGLSADKLVVSVSDDRAYAMMRAGLANPDNTWMTMFKAANPDPVKKSEEPKKETADSKTAKVREKAAKEK